MTDVYLYDFGQTSNLGFFYTSSGYNSGPDDYLYIYAFSPYDTFLLYFQDTYKSRVFYNFTRNDYKF